MGNEYIVPRIEEEGKGKRTQTLRSVFLYRYYFLNYIILSPPSPLLGPPAPS
jgi:hypothetical protein